MTGKGHKYRRRGSKARVAPSTDDDDSLVKKGHQMDTVDEELQNNNMSILKRFKAITTKSMSESNRINVISNIRSGTAKWRHYATARRKATFTENECGFDRRRAGGMGLMYDVTGDAVDGGSNTRHHVMVAQNRNLIEYFARLGQSHDEGEYINLDYVRTILKNGANINCTDKYGQSVFHEVSRAWHTDMAQFLIDNGANVNQGDNYGRTPLHVAAAVNYPEMVNFLIASGADKEILTKGEHQTPVHFAARNDACHSLKALIKQGCLYKDVRDFKGRTPLHLAAELDRSETAEMLLELDDPAPAGVEDSSGQAAIVWMISKMQPVAKLALDQFHTTDRANRKQFFHLDKLEPRKPDDTRDVHPQTALQMIVQLRSHELISHESVARIIHAKWRLFGKRRALFNTAFNLVLVVLWSAFGMIIDYHNRYSYQFPQHIYRVLLLATAFLFMVWQIKDEMVEYFSSRRLHKNWKDWREKEIQRDIEFSHPRWPEEEVYLRQQIDELDHMKPQYINDFWNIFDWLCYVLLIICTITHLVDIFKHSPTVARLHVRFMAVTIIAIWIRLMKNIRAYSLLGPFIVMLSQMMGDVIKFFYLYLLFYIPFVIAFWMLFGGQRVLESDDVTLASSANNTVQVDGFETFGRLLFSLFRITLVDDYDFLTMSKVDSVMSHILIGAWLAISAILLLNLFIALLSDTFQRVYDNAQANAVMQKAITILNIEEGMSSKKRRQFREYIHTACNPEETYYDDDTTDAGEANLKKVTFQIKDQLSNLEQAIKGEEDNDIDELSQQNSRRRALVTTEFLEQVISSLQNDIQSQQMTLLSKIDADFSALRSLLHNFAVQREIASNVEPSTIRAGLPAQTDDVDDGTPNVSRVSNMIRRQPAVSSQMQPHSGLLLGTHNLEMDDDWTRSEEQRATDLQRLRDQLAHQGQSVWSVTRPEAPPTLPTDRPAADTLTLEVTSGQSNVNRHDTQTPRETRPQQAVTPRPDLRADSTRVTLRPANAPANDDADSKC